MTKAELLELISNGENSGVEFKRDDLKGEQLAKEIAGFANLQGGRLFLGVEDNGDISGIQRENVQDWVFNVLSDKIHPLLIPFYEEIKIDETKRVAVISVTSGPSKPYVVRHNKREDIYIRMGSTTILAAREQQARLFETGGILHVEVMPVSGAGFEALDKTRIGYYFKNILKEAEIPVNDDDWISRLTGMGMMKDDGTGKKCCTIAGLLCFGLKPRRYFSQAGLRVMCFDGKDKSYSALLDTILDGALVARWEVDAAANPYKVEDGLIDKFTEIITPFISAENEELEGHVRRTRTWRYPLEAVREVVINALAHRDWTRSIDIEVSSYSDRLEVISPGVFPNSMDVNKMIAGQRLYRNALIVGVLRDYGYIDARGMGIHSKVIPLMRSQNKKDPTFEVTDDYIKTLLPAA
jgi:ATP-dependent DNA helicase RecG